MMCITEIKVATPFVDRLGDSCEFFMGNVFAIYMEIGDRISAQ